VVKQRIRTLEYLEGLCNRLQEATKKSVEPKFAGREPLLKFVETRNCSVFISVVGVVANSNLKERKHLAELSKLAK
jgi:hypothetical protein